MNNPLSLKKYNMLKEYDKPMKVPDADVKTISIYSCPRCKETIFRGDKFCKHCGQKLEWEE